MTREHPRVYIVTRNSFRDDIRTFLTDRGVPDTVKIRTVRGGVQARLGRLSFQRLAPGD